MNKNKIWEEFIYEYRFRLDFGWSVKVTIDFPFKDQADLETISQFPHGQRRKFARHILDKYAAESFHPLTDADIFNPFGVRLAQLFNNELQVYWMRRPTDTVLIITGSD